MPDARVDPKSGYEVITLGGSMAAIVPLEDLRAIQAGPQPPGMSHQEFERRLLAPQRRWEQYQLGDPAGLEKPERQRLRDATEVVRDSLGIDPELVADVIAAVVLRRELWEPDLRP